MTFMKNRRNTKTVLVAARLVLLFTGIGCNPSSPNAGSEGFGLGQRELLTQTPRFSLHERDVARSTLVQSRVQPSETKRTQDRVTEQHPGYILEYNRDSAAGDEGYTKLIGSIRRDAPNAIDFVERLYGKLKMPIQVQILGSWNELPPMSSGIELAQSASFDGATLHGVVYISSEALATHGGSVTKDAVYGLFVHELVHVIQHRQVGDLGEIRRLLAASSPAAANRLNLAAEEMASTVQQEALSSRRGLQRQVPKTHMAWRSVVSQSGRRPPTSARRTYDIDNLRCLVNNLLAGHQSALTISGAKMGLNEVPEIDRHGDNIFSHHLRNALHVRNWTHKGTSPWIASTHLPSR